MIMLLNLYVFVSILVMSLAVDSIGRWVYWILRENDKSKLFRAPTAEKLKDFIPNHVKEFDNLCTQGIHY